MTVTLIGMLCVIAIFGGAYVILSRMKNREFDMVQTALHAARDVMRKSPKFVEHLAINPQNKSLERYDPTTKKHTTGIFRLRYATITLGIMVDGYTSYVTVDRLDDERTIGVHFMGSDPAAFFINKTTPEDAERMLQQLSGDARIVHVLLRNHLHIPEPVQC